ncbi:zinc finger protein 658B-like [Condylostylus longicornis]|uniref:zinc finger protein 658B-like n=1 Tax=Condylostylus longicornis TaxID=2530218 RepID=UPI00244D9D8D|nr:zinc finger protein 658B-like [Condylostylus longicornis]
MLQKDWKKWCRLCGKKGGSEVDFTFKFESTETLAEIAMKYFGILISKENYSFTKICVMCHETISSIIKYNAHVVKVNEMFQELENFHMNQNTNFETLREKYGLDNEIGNSDIYAVQTKIDLESESDKKSTSPLQIFLKTEIMNVDEDCFLEETNNSNNVEEDSFSNVCSTDQKAEETLKIKKEKDKGNSNNSNVDVLSTELDLLDEKYFQCNICEKYFSSKRARARHIRQKHSENLDLPSHKCSTCGRFFKNLWNLNAHEVTHLSKTDRKLYDCPQCSKQFTSEAHMQDHIRVIHKKEKSFICELCGAAFGRSGNLFDHRLTHSTEKKFKCSKCEKTFKCKRSLKIHFDTHEGTEYSCQICGIKLNTKRILRRHMIVHSDLNKYKCNFCSKQFKRADAFKNHIILHTGLKPYQCPFCGLAFANGSNCRKHQVTVHPTELSDAKLAGTPKIVQNIPSIKQLKAVNEEALIGKNILLFKMQQKDWKKWCRLCGKKDGSDIDITLKFESTETLSEAIIKYFGIMIPIENNCCTKICIMCHDTINSIIKYNAHAIKVNEMFTELENNHLNQTFDVEPLREKYGLNNETHVLFENEMRPADFCAVQVKVDSKSKADSKMSSSPSKCPLKTEVVDVDELNFLEETNAFDEGPNDILSSDCNPGQNLVEEFFNVNLGKSDEMNTLSKKGEESISIASKSNEEKCVECNICQKRFVTARGRTIHMKQKHAVKIGPPPYKCNVCGRLFKRIQHLNAHEVVHLSENDRKLYACPQCNKKFTNEWYVQDHIRIVHKRDRPFICELCGAAFGSNRNLVDHHLTHSEEKKFKCPKCEKTFKCKRALKLHVDIHDDTEYICQVCGLKLNTRRILRRHMIVHSDLNKYRCNFCSKQFKRPDAFKNHLILHTGLKPYECSFCDLTFANGSNCRKHQRTTHPVELAAAELKGKQKLAKNVPSIKQLKAVNEEALLNEKKINLNFDTNLNTVQM